MFAKISLVQVFLFVLRYFSSFAKCEECTVTLVNGVVIGAVVDTVNDSRKVCTYKAIPYALPPVGQLRFQPPQPAETWGTLNATTEPNWCPQAQGALSVPGTNISEDCLYLNVHVPRGASEGGELPVMVWIHGGSFTSGSTFMYNPRRLLAHGDVILVVIQYRLGYLGFLSTGDSTVPGNLGLKDQTLSLRWVKDNIGAFGGNPNNVTVFGESAGGASVLYHLLSPLSSGLVHGVIASSGNPLTTGAYDRSPVEKGKRVAAAAGCPVNSSQEMVDCLRTLSWETIVEAQKNDSVGSAPVVEPDLPGAFITANPMEIMKNGEIDTRIPVMLGANKHDASLALAAFYKDVIGPQGLDRNPEYMRNQLLLDIFKTLDITEDASNLGVASSFQIAYLAGVNRSDWNASMPGLVDMLTVVAVKSSLLHTAELLSARGVKTYLYSFEHHSNNSMFSLFFPNTDIPVGAGITHADDLFYLFDLLFPFSEQDMEFSQKMCEMWINLAAFGNPTPVASDRYGTWPTYDTNTEAYMKLNVSPTVYHDYQSSWRPNGFEWN